MDLEDNAKVSSIAEVCHVSTDEAASVLVACRMDETLAIERFLSGEVKTSTWSEVSKKKKYTPFRPRTARGARKEESTGKLAEEVDCEYSTRETSSLNRMVSGRTHPVLNRAVDDIPVFRQRSTVVLGETEKEFSRKGDKGSCFRGRVSKCNTTQLELPRTGIEKSSDSASSSTPCPRIANYLASSPTASDDRIGCREVSDSVMNPSIPPTSISEESERHVRAIENVVQDVKDKNSSALIGFQGDGECRNLTASQPAIEVSTIPAALDHMKRRNAIFRVARYLFLYLLLDRERPVWSRLQWQAGLP